MQSVLMKLFTIIALTVMLAISAQGRETYTKQIPNPDGISGVSALGHVNPSGGGARNKFGADFGEANMVWTKALCQKDSDGDGVSNGAELGDPCCTWSVTTTTGLITTGLSHPGDATSTTTSASLISPNCTASAGGSTSAPSTDSADSADGGTNSFALVTSFSMFEVVLSLSIAAFMI